MSRHDAATAHRGSKAKRLEWQATLLAAAMLVQCARRKVARREVARRRFGVEVRVACTNRLSFLLLLHLGT